MLLDFQSYQNYLDIFLLLIYNLIATSLEIAVYVKPILGKLRIVLPPQIGSLFL